MFSTSTSVIKLTCMKECIKQIPGVLVGVFLLGALLRGAIWVNVICCVWLYLGGRREEAWVEGRGHEYFLLIVFSSVGLFEIGASCSSGWLQTHDPAAHSECCLPALSCVLKSGDHCGLDCHVFSCTTVTYRCNLFIEWIVRRIK